MCFGGRPSPSPPPLPEARPTPPKPEKTAERVVVGSNRTKPAPAKPKPNVTGQQTTGETGRKRTGQRQQRAKRLGTSQLRIPLMKKNQGSSDLRY